MKKEKDYQETPENQAENGAAENAAEESEEAGVSPEEEKIAALTAETEALKASVSEYKDKWIRSVAEFDNYKKRTAKCESKAYKDGKSEMLKKVFFIGDSLDWALAMELDEKTADGIRQLRKKFASFLEGEGVTEIDPVGEVFDPHVSEAVMQVPAEEGETAGTVKQVVQKGYRFGEDIIRVARVIVIG